MLQERNSRHWRLRDRRQLLPGAGADVIAKVTEEMSKEFGTLELRTWADGKGVQCECRLLAGDKFCGRHRFG